MISNNNNNDQFRGAESRT